MYSFFQFMGFSLNHKNTPFSPEFNDQFFSDEDGLAESRYVFLENNDLPNRWHSKPNFVIGELGFGTSLNFLATFDLWKSMNSKTKLTYISFEKYPLSASQIESIIQRWSELDYPLQKLLQKYPKSFSEGPFISEFEDENIQLILMIGDALEMIDSIQYPVDAWYLDGFAPSKNPDLWSLEILKKLFKASNNNATASTYSAASIVRRHLIEAGFQVTKQKGFGRKREMLKAKKLG